MQDLMGDEDKTPEVLALEAQLTQVSRDQVALLKSVVKDANQILGRKTPEKVALLNRFGRELHPEVE
jgi:hypothetical protein